MPIPVKTITITRAEGPNELCGITKRFNSFEEASKWLRSISYTFPNNGTYDKTDFTIEWEDGQTYNGRLDCKDITCPDNDLDVYQHVLDFATYYAGMKDNPYRGRMTYRRTLINRDQYSPGSTKSYRELLTKYLLDPTPETLGTFCERCDIKLTESEAKSGSICIYCAEDDLANMNRYEKKSTLIRVFQTDPGVEPDGTDARIASERLEVWDRNASPRIGDYVIGTDGIYKRINASPRIGDYVIETDGTYKRIAALWPDSIQVSNNGSYYLGYGHVMMSGELNVGIPREKFRPTVEKKPGMFWIFHHDIPQAHHGVGVEAFCRVYRILD